jgi:type II secretory pathway component PulC
MTDRPERPEKVTVMIASRRKRADRLSGGALLCLAAGLCGAAWLALRRPVSVEPSPAPAAAQVVSATAPVAQPPEDLSILWAGANESPASSLPAAGLAASGAETPPFTLRGVIASLSGDCSVAFVQAAGGASLILHPGEVAQGWTLVGVKGNDATFGREGREIILSLAKPEYAAGGGPASAGAASTPPSSPQRPGLGKAISLATPPLPLSGQTALESPSVAAASTAVGSAASSGTGGATVIVPQSFVDSIRGNPLAATQGLQIQMPNGQTTGITIASVAAGAPAAPYVSSGDRILAVNGTAINSASDALNLYQQLTASGSTSVTVTLERGGQRQNVVYTIK